MDRAHAAEQQLVSYPIESSRSHPFGQLPRPGKRPYRLWQPGVGISMFRYEPSDQRQDMAGVREVQRPERLARRGGEFQNHQACLRFEHPRGFAEPGVEIDEVPDAEADRGALERGIAERERERW